MTTMTARFASVCPTCSSAIRKGAEINYTRGMAATHSACGTPATATAGAARSHGRHVVYNRGGRCNCEDYPCCGC